MMRLPVFAPGRPKSSLHRRWGRGSAGVHRHESPAALLCGSVLEATQHLGERTCSCRRQGLEQRDVHRFNGLDGPGRQGRPGGSDDNPAGSGVIGIDLTGDQTLLLEGSDDLRRHLHIGTCVRGERGLRWLLVVRVEPPGAGEQHELNVRQPSGLRTAATSRRQRRVTCHNRNPGLSSGSVMIRSEVSRRPERPTCQRPRPMPR